jgi:hypothetical protein
MLLQDCCSCPVALLLLCAPLHQRRKLGPINWGSCSELRQREWAGLDKQQVQEEEEELREVRRLQLETLGKSNGVQLASIARFFSTLEPMSRTLATQVLESSVVPQLLELDVRYNAQVRPVNVGLPPLHV